MHSDNPNKLRPLEAWRALRRLLRDPEDTAQVFTIVRALTGRSLVRAYRRFAATPTGQTILQEKRSLLDRLEDRTALAALPSGSLGRAYLSFVQEESLTADGLVEASASDQQIDDAGLALYSERVRDMHDLWHTTTGYGRDVSGEACLLAFTVAQVKNPGLALITVAGMLKIARETDRRIIPAVWRAYLAGRRARWMPAEDWEALLEQPIDEVRAYLNIRAPEIYPEIVAGLATG